jgi:hypothetical protein
MTIYLNHLGFTPSAAKFAVLGGGQEPELFVCRAADGQVVYRAQFKRFASDFGQYSLAEFSDFQQSGEYFLRAALERSQPFRIDPGVYHGALELIQGYFRLQRCGDAATGWNGPCHLDDGLRGDTHQHQDVSGGWHDACDLRKWVGATIFGMLGLVRQPELTPAIEEELRWGNRYFLAMQEPAGYLMNYVGGDYYVHADNNRWTDNLADGRDDRLIEVSPCDTLAQWVFVLVESVLAVRLAERDPHYAAACRAAAERCAAWLLDGQLTRTAGELGAALSALLELQRAAPSVQWQEAQFAYSERLLALQVTRQFDSRSSTWGFFWQQLDPKGPMAYEPYRDIWRGCWPLIGLCDLLAAHPAHERATAWQQAIELFCAPYLQALASRGVFGNVPYGLYRSDPGGGRNLGRFWLRYFHEENPNWYVGINSLLASCGVGLLKAARLLGRNDWAALAQRQLDWILGSNPFNASTVMGVGYNNPQHMFGFEYDPPTPFLPGAVMNGISGDAADHPQLRPGAWQECEYWTPMVCFTMWLMAEIR